jgi:vacuolar-type H+-ATPase subunit I/STV1
MGESCVPNLMLLPFAELIKWIDKRQRHLDWTSQDLADKSNVPVGTIKRIKAGEYMDCKYSTIKSILIALIGGTTDEFACTELVEKELQNIERLEQQTAKLSAIEEENRKLKDLLSRIDELHRKDIRVIRDEYMKQKEEYQEQINFLKDELKARRALNQSK